MNEHHHPIVSVVIPAYNRAHTLPRAIRSVFTQTFGEWEIIVVDDASSDQTDQVIKEFSDGRVRYIRHQQNRGPSAARNTGIRAARGVYVAFLDSDDEWLPEKLAYDVSLFDSQDLGMVCSGEIFGESHARLASILSTVHGRVYDRLLAHDFIGSCSGVTVRRIALETLGGFDEQLTNEEDWDLWLRISKVFAIGVAPRCLVRRHSGSDQLTGSPGSLRRIYEGRARIIEKHRQHMPPSILAKHLADLSGLLLNYDIPRARKLGRESLRLKKLQPRLLAALMISLFGVSTYRSAFSRMAKIRHGVYLGRAQV